MITHNRLAKNIPLQNPPSNVNHRIFSSNSSLILCTLATTMYLLAIYLLYVIVCENPPCLRILRSLTQMTVYAYRFTYLQLVFTKIQRDHLSINEQTFIIFHSAVAELPDFKLQK